jgi:hypothetical protein
VINVPTYDLVNAVIGVGNATAAVASKSSSGSGSRRRSRLHGVGEVRELPPAV